MLARRSPRRVAATIRAVYLAHRRRALVTLAAVAASVTTTASTPPAVAQTLTSPTASVSTSPLDPTLNQLLELTGGVSRGKLKMIEEEGYLCFLAFHPIPPGISWVCLPPL